VAIVSAMPALPSGKPFWAILAVAVALFRQLLMALHMKMTTNITRPTAWQICAAPIAPPQVVYGWIRPAVLSDRSVTEVRRFAVERARGERCSVSKRFKRLINMRVCVSQATALGAPTVPSAANSHNHWQRHLVCSPVPSLRKVR
jgi:hypothetical protein